MANECVCVCVHEAEGGMDGIVCEMKGKRGSSEY